MISNDKNQVTAKNKLKDNQDYKELVNRHVSVRRVLALFRPYRWQLVVVIALILVGSGVGITMPFLLREIIDKALPNADIRLLIILVIAMVVMATVSAGINMAQTVMSTKIGQNILHDMRVRIYAHLQSLSMRFFTGTRSGEIQSRISNDIGRLQEFASNTARELARNFSVAAMTCIAMLLLDWRLALFSLVVLPAILLLSSRVGNMREAITHQQQKRMADMSSEIQETLSVSGIMLAKTMGRTTSLIRRFSRTSKDVANLEVRSLTAGEWQWQLIYLLLSILPALTLLFGGLLLGSSVPVTIGTLVALIALQEQLIWPLEELLHTGMEMKKTRALFARIYEYLDKPVEISERKNPVTLKKENIKGAVRLDNVSFSYKHGQQTLSGISIDIPAGSHVAIVGPTGSGKTTLGYLLARLYDVDSGAIYYDGVDIRDLSFQSLNDVLGVVSQEPFLLNETVADNLRFAKPDATDEELVTVAKIAQLHDFLSELPQGYHTLVGDRGYRFSGGEKQRLALARTILRNPSVILLDEATSALDTRTERKVSTDLTALSQGHTTITIAHRLSTVRNADQIIVLQKGKIIERGTHDQLEAQGGLYANLLRSASGL